MIVRILLYLAAVVVANLLVTTYGRIGLLFSSTLLIPFDFVLRCYFHERWKGTRLVLYLGTLVGIGAVITYILNQDSQNVALGSVCGFVVANAGAGVFYQLFIDRSTFIKVNGSDLVAIIIDSVVFQLVAFDSVDGSIMLGQMAIKFLGGLLWFFILFKVFKMSVTGPTIL